MTQRTAPPSALATGVVADVVELDAAGQAPEWIKVMPAGEVTTRDGRTYIFDAASLAARYTADGVDVPVDVDHAISRRAAFGEQSDAVGWVKELSARADGLHARVEWLESGRAILAARTHRYISPTFPHDAAGRATWLHSVALVAAPALAMPAIAAASLTQEPPVLQKIAAALGLAETADEAACLSAISTLAAGRVDRAVHDQALATLAAATAELDAIKARTRADKVAALLDDALAAKKILPAQRPQYEALCASDDGLAQVTALIGATPAGLQASGLDSRRAPEGDAPADPAALAAAAHAYQRRQAEDGRHIAYADAVVAIKEGRK